FMSASRQLIRFLLMCCAIPVRAQDAQLSGRITDHSTAVVPQAGVSVLNEETGIKRTTESNEAGIYSIPSLAPGRYKVTVQARGFQTVMRTGVRLGVAQNARLDFTLEVGAVEQVVTVTGGNESIQSIDGSVGITVSRQLVDNLPLNGRSFQ